MRQQVAGVDFAGALIRIAQKRVAGSFCMADAANLRCTLHVCVCVFVFVFVCVCVCVCVCARARACVHAHV
jgi:hypothetical protein